jgi:cell volume regulation protein A
VPFGGFRKWFLSIASLSLVGVILSSVLFAIALVAVLKAFFGFDPGLLPSVVILSAALASTDPTAIIPTLQSLRFKRPFLKQIAVSESALTDVSGSIVTRFLLVAVIGAAVAGGGVLGMFAPLFEKASYDALALQIVSGVLVGWLGYVTLRRFYGDGEKGTDPALLLAVPVFTFGLGNVLGGAGFLAAFVSGLLSEIRGGLKPAAHFYASFLDHLIKPFIFIVLGALVPVMTLIALAPVGVIAGLLFMFVIRPIVVLVSLLPWLVSGVFTWRDLLFLSFIRETGIIAAVLIVIASSYGAIDSDFVVAVGMWVILMTLVIEPPLTPWVARKVGVAEKA